MSAALKTPYHDELELSYVYRRRALLPELSSVVLLIDVQAMEGVTIPAGSEGTIVGTWKDGAGYEIEFSEPVEGLATVEASALRASGDV